MIDEDQKGKYERGLRAFRNKEYEAAVEYFSGAVEYDEKNDKAWNALGTACAKVGRYPDADLCFENALTISPDNEIYLKNRISNAKNLKNPPNLPKGNAGSFLDALPLDLIPINRTYLLIGIGLVAILIIGAILLFILSFFTTPAAPPGPPFQITANLSGSSIILTNGGGSEIGKVTSFLWKVNDKPVGTGTAGDPSTLAVTPGSTARISLAEIADTNLSNGMKVMVIANLKEGGAIMALSTSLPPPPPGVLQAFAPVTATPTPAPPGAKFAQGEVIYTEGTGTYWLLNATPVNGTYSLNRAARAPNGSFVPIDETVVSEKYTTFEQSGKSIGTRLPGGTPPGLPSVNPPPVAEVQAVHPEPVFQTGDLVNSVEKGDFGMIVILGYDPVTDQYQADSISRYYSGEWGYRNTSTPMWFIRPVLEQRYTHRIDRTATSDIGIGADSAPPRSPVKYHLGDVISPDTAGLDNLLIITGYTDGDDSYMINTVRSAYGGGWIMPGTPHPEKRAYVERDYPYLIKSVDLALVRAG